jgi:hypothetical protein
MAARTFFPGLVVRNCRHQSPAAVAGASRGLGPYVLCSVDGVSMNSNAQIDGAKTRVRQEGGRAGPHPRAIRRRYAGSDPCYAKRRPTRHLRCYRRFCRILATRLTAAASRHDAPGPLLGLYPEPLSGFASGSLTGDSLRVLAWRRSCSVMRSLADPRGGAPGGLAPA